MSRAGAIPRPFGGGVGAIAFAAMFLLSCAPEPTDPATTSLAGAWTSSNHAFALSQIKLTMVQEANGIVSGGWTARVDAGTPGCASGITCSSHGNLIGRNLVSQVTIDLTGAGVFQGSLVAPAELRGVFSIPDASDSVTFFRTGG